MKYDKIISTAECSAVPHSTRDDCPYCHAQGVPILPVRYAVHLDEKLNPLVPAQGYTVPALPTPSDYPPLLTQHYTLRLLRSGYLYLFDQAAERLAAWKIDDKAKYAAFALNNTDANGVPNFKLRMTRKNEKPAPFRCNQAGHCVPASLIHWPLKRRTTVWLLYSPIPIPTAALQRQVHDAGWRESQMQRVDLQAPTGEHIFPAARISVLLAENHDDRSKAYAPHDYLREYRLGGDIGATFTDYMARYQQERHETGVMVALNDDLGMFEALNHHRHLPEETFNQTMGHAPDKDDYQCTAAELKVRRQLMGYNMLNMLLQQKSDEIRADIEHYADQRSQPLEREKLAQQRIRQVGGDITTYGASSRMLGEIERTTPQIYAKQQWNQLPLAQALITDNFLEHVDAAAFQTFKQRYDQAVAEREKQLDALDKDYSDWLSQRGPALCEGLSWTRDYAVTACFFQHIILRCLMGNVMTVHSHALWHSQLLAPQKRSVLIDALGLHDPRMIEVMNAELTADEAGYIDTLLSGKDLVKLGEELNNYLAKVGMGIIHETALALMSRPGKLMAEALPTPSIIAMQQKWKPRLIRLQNLYRRLTDQSVLHAIELKLPASDYHNFIRSLPKAMIADLDGRALKNITNIQHSNGQSLQIRHLPYDKASPRANEPLIAITLTVEENIVEQLKSLEHGGERVCTVKLLHTNESFTMHPAQAAPIERSFGNLLRQGVVQPGHSAVGVLLAMSSLYYAWEDRSLKAEDMVELVSSILGMSKATTGFIDTIHKGMTDASQVGELRLLEDAPWCRRVGQASNFLGLVSALLELLNAVDAWQAGEPRRVVKWTAASAGASALTAVLAYTNFLPGIAAIVGIAAVLMGVVFTALSYQVLTLPQRIWLYRSVFGRHDIPYHDRQPFGHEHEPHPDVLIDSLIDYISIRFFGGQPQMAEFNEEASKTYHRIALKEEIDALAMLAKGISVKIEKWHIDYHQMKNIDDQLYAEEKAALKDATTHVAIVLLIPENIDGFVSLELSLDESDSIYVDKSKRFEFKNKYKKLGEKFVKIKNENEEIGDMKFSSSNGFIASNIFFNIPEKEYTLIVEYFTFDSPYFPAARDKFGIRGLLLCE